MLPPTPIALQTAHNLLILRLHVLMPCVFCIHRRLTPITTPCLEAVKSLCACRSPHQPQPLSPKGSQLVPYAPVSYSYLNHLVFPSHLLDLPLSSVARGFFCT